MLSRHPHTSRSSATVLRNGPEAYDLVKGDGGFGKTGCTHLMHSRCLRGLMTPIPLDAATEHVVVSLIRQISRAPTANQSASRSEVFIEMRKG